MSDDLVSTTLNNWLENNPENSELVASIDISNKKYNPPTFNDNTGIYSIFKNLDSHLLSVLDGADSYNSYDSIHYKYYGDLSHGQIVKNNVICKRIGDVLVDKYKDIDEYGVDKIRFAGGDPSYNTQSGEGEITNSARKDEIFGGIENDYRGMANAYSHTPGIGIRLLKNDKWDNSFNTQGFSVHGDSSFNTIINGGDGYTYFDFSNNFLIDLLENTNTDQSYMKSYFYKDPNHIKFIYHPTKNTIGEIESLDTSVKYKTTSDERLKTKINDLSPEEGLNICLQLRPVRYNWKSQPNNQKELGLIAQEVYKILEEKYDENLEKTQMIDYSIFNPIIISAVQCIQKRIGKLKHLLYK